MTLRPAASGVVRAQDLPEAAVTAAASSRELADFLVEWSPREAFVESGPDEHTSLPWEADVD
jgi:uncharacterized membrane-anchored protein